MRHKKYVVSLISAAALACSARAQGDATLAGRVDQRLRSDRTDACLAVAVIEHEDVTKTFRCASDEGRGRIGPDTAFELGSVTKTFAATVAAAMIVRGELSLDDPLSALLPMQTKVPSFEGAPISLRHLLTHTSGLPRLPAGVQPSPDPYADITEHALLESLGEVSLKQAPGTLYEYSNFGYMLLSAALAHRAGIDFPTLVAREILTPLAMRGAYVIRPPPGAHPAQGHLSSGAPTPPWTFAPNLAGACGVHATLDDMVRYVRAQLGQESALAVALRLSHAPLSAARPVAMAWHIDLLGDRPITWHSGATGGAASIVALDLTRGRGVVVLSDTAWPVGALDELAIQLLDDGSASHGAAR